MLATQMTRHVAAEVMRLCASGFDSTTLRQRVIGQLQAVIPYDAYCCGTIDPLTLLITSEVAAGIPAAAFPIAAANEYLGADVGKFVVLARGQERSAILSRATAGRPERSQRYRDVLEPFGFGPELRAAFVDRGLCWGGVTLMRYQRQPDFTPTEARFLSRLSAHIAAGLRAALVREASAATTGSRPGVVVLDDCLRVESFTPEAEYWLDELLGYGNLTTALLPRPIYEVASRVRALATGGDPESPPAHLRVRTRAGQWLVLYGSRLTHARLLTSRTAIVIEVAHPLDVAPLLIQAYGFSPREQMVLTQVLNGASMAETASALGISTYTVGDYLKAIFDRVGVRSQRELITHFLSDPTATDANRAVVGYGNATRRLVAR